MGDISGLSSTTLRHCQSLFFPHHALYTTQPQGSARRLRLLEICEKGTFDAEIKLDPGVSVSGFDYAKERLGMPANDWRLHDLRPHHDDGDGDLNHNSARVGILIEYRP